MIQIVYQSSKVQKVRNKYNGFNDKELIVKEKKKRGKTSGGISNPNEFDGEIGL
jgi:hypothetical protein